MERVTVLCLISMNMLISSSSRVPSWAKVKYNYFKIYAINEWVRTFEEIVFPALHALVLICFLFKN